MWQYVPMFCSAWQGRLLAYLQARMLAHLQMAACRIYMATPAHTHSIQHHYARMQMHAQLNTCKRTRTHMRVRMCVHTRIKHLFSTFPQSM